MDGVDNSKGYTYRASGMLGHICNMSVCLLIIFLVAITTRARRVCDENESKGKHEEKEQEDGEKLCLCSLTKDIRRVSSSLIPPSAREGGTLRSLCFVFVTEGLDGRENKDARCFSFP